MLSYLSPEHVQDVMGMRTICPISQLASFGQLRVLHHPYLFNSFQKSGEAMQVEEVKGLLESD